ncbi:ABC transporter substrate-binding protein [Amycolatopsis sp. PS_44_ISF1]|uniref:ABC transporter substrate-binding protein n=1 Tax=Amycolatopsis sp. PS_44_ISF1 TaxID=2974917 RepID=UPI0028DE4FB0|nr:ABC transporter substrate-binding protein [Amycolatopsis sp. PS_44_ISF1]MDT8913819.1 ABC transporter substrate-binding protein [Amycolatopsis sp. PS_44_ISF1]
MRQGIRRGQALAGAAVVAGALVAGCSAAGGTTISLYLSPEDHLPALIDRCTREAGGRYRIVYDKLPRAADGQREQLVRRLAAGDDSMDVLGLDVTWVPEFAEAGWIEPWTGADRAAATDGVLPGPLATARWNGKLYGATKNTNIQLLWYDDRLTPAPPRTFDEMMAQSQRLKAAGKPYEVVFTGAQYEGLVVFYNTLVASEGGHILSADGKTVVMDEGAVKALGLLKTLAGTGITDPSLTSQKEDEVRLAFQRGQAAFQLNWPFVYAAYAQEKPQELAHLKWAPYPAAGPGTPPRTTIGGYNLAISAYSPHKREAFEAALCLRNAESQKYQALLDGEPPSLASLYQDTTPLDPARPADASANPTMAQRFPMKDDIRTALGEAAVRPLTPAYQNLSTVISKVLSPPAGINPRATAQELRERLGDALESRGIIP